MGYIMEKENSYKDAAQHYEQVSKMCIMIKNAKVLFFEFINLICCIFCNLGMEV